MTSYHLTGDGPAADVLADAIVGIDGDIVGPDNAEITVAAGVPSDQAATALRAVAEGRSAIVCSPIAATLADADRLLRVVAANGELSLGESLLFAPAHRAIADAVAGLGPLEHLGIRFHQAVPSWGGDGRRTDGGGASLDLGTRALALLLSLVPGRTIAGVRARFDNRTRVVDERAELKVRFDDGLMAEVDVAWTDDTGVLDLQASSAEHAAFCQLLPEVVVEVDGESVPHPAGDHADAVVDLGYQNLVQEAAYARTIGAAIRISPLTLGHQAFAAVTAAARAAATGAEVTLPLEGDRDRTPVQLWRPE